DVCGTTWALTPPGPVAEVHTNQEAASVPDGATVQLPATPKDPTGLPASGTVTWASNNAALATVSTSGLVTGRVVGTAAVTATSGGQSGSATVTVNSVSGYTLGNGANYYLAPGGSDANPCSAAAPCY